MQQTCVLVKPDGLQRGLIGEIITRFERKGLKLVAIKMIRLDEATLEQWYEHLKDKPFFGDVKKYMTWTPIIAMVWEGLEVIPAVRKVVGITKAREAEAGSIRGDLGMSSQNNLIHASDSVEAASKEINLIFQPEELHDYSSVTEELIYGKAER